VNDAVLVVIDRLTKMAPFGPCRTTITAEETTHLFISVIVRLHGIPAVIISDRDMKFISRFSTAYHPQTDATCRISVSLCDQ
ncbi:hypothetical protein CLOM_g11517, partial [Closterium sp. NIES-68]